MSFDIKESDSFVKTIQRNMDENSENAMLLYCFYEIFRKLNLKKYIVKLIAISYNDDR